MKAVLLLTPTHYALDRIKNRAAKLADLTPRGRLIPELLDTGISHYRELIESLWS